MRRSIWLWLLCIIVMSGLSGCNLPNTNITTGGEAVAILEPADGEQLPLDKLVVVRSEIQSARGVVRVDLLVNGSSVRSDKLSLSLYQGVMTQAWQPDAPGEYDLRVQAYETGDTTLVSQTVNIMVGEAASNEEDKRVPTTAVPDVPTFTPTPTATITPTATQTLTPTLGPPMVTALDYANCRYGPSTIYEVINALGEGLSALIIGRNTESTWWLIETQEAYGKCWIYDGVVEISGDTSRVPVVSAPPTPTFTSTPVVYTAPVPISPSGTIKCGDTTGGLTFSWSEAGPYMEVSYYEWVLDGGGGTRSGKEGTTQTLVHSIGCYNTYTWKVRAVYINGTVGSYSTEMVFKVE